MIKRVFEKEAQPNRIPAIPALRDYFQTLISKGFIKERIVDADVERIEAIVNRNNTIGQLLQTDEYKAILAEEKEIKGDAKLGGVICIDGRFTTIHPFGRSINIWEEPAAFAEVADDSEDPRLESAQFNEALRAAAKDGRDLLEIVFAHTSLTTDGVCGRMKGGEAEHEFDGLPAELATLEAKNLYILEHNQIPAITSTFNEFRQENGLSPLKQVAISATFDTDTMGVILNLGSDHEFSTTTMMREIKDDLQFMMGEHFGIFGGLRDQFTETEHFIDFSKRAVEITKVLLTWDKFTLPAQNYINEFYPDLTIDQKNALIFTLARTSAAQYITGLADVPKEGPNHLFAEHEESYMSVSLDGKPMGRFDFGDQSFGSSPSKTSTAIEHIHTKLTLLDKHHKHDLARKPDILFVSKIVDADLWRKYDTAAGDQTIKRALGKHGQFYGELCKDQQIKERMQNGSLIVVPVLLDQETGEVLDVINQSIYLRKEKGKSIQ